MEYYINNLQRSMLTNMAKRSLHMYTLTHPHAIVYVWSGISNCRNMNCWAQLICILRW